MRLWVVFGCALAALSVILGAFGAHALKATLSAERLLVWDTAVRYQMFTALGILSLALQRRWGHLGLALLGLGALIFSGSLYLLCLLDQGWLGAITPLGGSLMILGWLHLAWSAWKMEEVP